MKNLKKFGEVSEERMLGRSMSKEALQRDTDESDNEYIAAKQKKEHAKDIDSWTDDEVKKVFATFDDGTDPWSVDNLSVKQKRDVLKKHQTKFEKSFEGNMEGILKYDSFVDEKWKDSVEVEHTGENTDKTVETLKKEADALRAKKDKTKGESTELRQKNFAIRAKQKGSSKWGKVKEMEEFLSEDEILERHSDEEWKDLEIDSLIKELEECKKKGATTVEFTGTLMCKHDGNYVIASTEEQH